MSLGYAEKLSYREDVGTVGMSEIFDPTHVLQQKIEQLALMVQKSKHLVAFTGAGISTSCGIPDFRGPKGVWTLQREGKGVPEASLPFHRAMPSITHMALVELEKAGILKFVISQVVLGLCVNLDKSKIIPIGEILNTGNVVAILRCKIDALPVTHVGLPWGATFNVRADWVGYEEILEENVDSLHLRSGIPREKLAELHGNSFMEICPKCGVEYLRDFEVETVGLKETSRRCSDENCGAKLKDSVLDWEDALPPKEMKAAAKHCRMADIILCLGTSLQITPACNLPLKCLRIGGKIVIVNLQQTPKDNKASLLIHGLVDKVIAGVMHYLNLRIPPHVRVDLFQVVFTQFHCISEKMYARWSLGVTSVHGDTTPVPFIKSVEVSFPERPKLKAAVLQRQPFLLKREVHKTRPLKVLLKLNFTDGCGCLHTNIEFPVNFQAPLTNFNLDKNAVTRKLRDTAIRDQCCGQFSVVERTICSNPKKEIGVYAVATNIVWYGGSLPTSRFSEARLEVNNSAKRHDYANATEVPIKKLKVH